MVYQYTSTPVVAMPVSVVAKWSSRGEPRFVEMLDALTRACDGVPIARDEVKRPTSSIFSNLVVCVSVTSWATHLILLHLCIFSMLSSFAVWSLTSLRMRAVAVARSACVT